MRLMCFASQFAIPDDEIIDYIHHGYNIQQVASVVNLDINLVALMVEILNWQGYEFREQECRNDFLKINIYFIFHLFLNSIVLFHQTFPITYFL